MLKLPEKMRGYEYETVYAGNVEVLQGGACAICKIPPYNITLKVRCHSCEYAKITNDDMVVCPYIGAGSIPIMDYRSTRCGAYTPKKKWINAIINGEKIELRTLTESDKQNAIRSFNKWRDHLTSKSQVDENEKDEDTATDSRG